jgi:hypothetical protein
MQILPLSQSITMEALYGKEAKKQSRHGNHGDLDIHLGRADRSRPILDAACGSAFGGDRWRHLASQKVVQRVSKRPSSPDENNPRRLKRSS